MKCYNVLVLFSLLISGCSTQYEYQLEKKIFTPKSVEVYDINVENVYTHPNNKMHLLENFPFVSNQPVVDFKGKFSDEFYDKINYRYKAAPLKDVDFWKLRDNPFSQDFIYVLPIWVNKFQKVSNDLFENIGYSYNLSLKEQEILKWWVGEGGILWVEGGTYSTRYDTFKKNGEIASDVITKKVIQKSENMIFFDKKVRTYLYKSKRIDFVNYMPLVMAFTAESNIDYFKDIKTLKIQTHNYLSADYLPQAQYLIKDKKNNPLVSFVPYGQGGVLFVRPFEYKDKRYDGELLRWKLVYYLMNKMYLSNNQTSKVQKTNERTMQKLEQYKRVSLNNLEFEYDSFLIKKESLAFLEPVVKYLKKHPDAKLLITGYTDNKGTKEYNKNLSTKRALSVRNALVNMGIVSSRLSYIGHADENPIASNKTPEGQRKNRRVEFLILQR